MRAGFILFREEGGGGVHASVALLVDAMLYYTVGNLRVELSAGSEWILVVIPLVVEMLLVDLLTVRVLVLFMWETFFIRSYDLG